MKEIAIRLRDTIGSLYFSITHADCIASLMLIVAVNSWTKFGDRKYFPAIKESRQAYLFCVLLSKPALLSRWTKTSERKQSNVSLLSTRDTVLHKELRITVDRKGIVERVHRLDTHVSQSATLKAWLQELNFLCDNAAHKVARSLDLELR